MEGSTPSPVRPDAVPDPRRRTTTAVSAPSTTRPTKHLTHFLAICSPYVTCTGSSSVPVTISRACRRAGPGGRSARRHSCPRRGSRDPVPLQHPAAPALELGLLLRLQIGVPGAQAEATGCGAGQHPDLTTDDGLAEGRRLVESQQSALDQVLRVEGVDLAPRREGRTATVRP